MSEWSAALLLQCGESGLVAIICAVSVFRFVGRVVETGGTLLLEGPAQSKSGTVTASWRAALIRSYVSIPSPIMCLALCCPRRARHSIKIGGVTPDVRDRRTRSR